ncbi:MAG: S9 family peptidase [Candidatus Heimdallarchaeota archaeon]|nr:S9 family peptidase [Candidatus Heimdallarchaeota archaeon]
MITESSQNEKTVIGIDDLYNFKQIIYVVIRPTSNEVYYIINQAKKEDNGYRNSIWRYNTKASQFTQGLPSDTSLKWSPDGTMGAFLSIRPVLSKSQQGKPSEPPKPQIYSIPNNGGEGIQLTTLSTGVSPPFEWSKDGKKIIFISRLNKEELEAPKPEEMKDMDPDEVTIMQMNAKKLEEKKVEPRIITRNVYRSGTSFLDDRKGQIHVIDVESGKVERWTNSLEDDYTFAYLAPDNSYALSARQKPGEPDECRIWELVKIYPKGEITIITKDHFDLGYFEPSPDGKFIVTSIGREKLGTLGLSDLCIYNVETGERKIYAEEIDSNKDLPKWSNDSKFVYFLVLEKGRSIIWRLEVATSKLEKVVDGDKLIYGFDISDDGEWLAYQGMYVNDPSRLYRYHIPTKKEELIHAPNEEFLKKKKLGKTEEVWYEGYNNDFKIQGWILTPPDFDPEKKYPLVLNIHGGPHVMWSNHQGIPMFHEFQILAGEGYVVFYCNPRGSGGYGQEFFKAIEKSWGDADSQDILHGVDLVVKRGFIDSKRMAITGGSYGGFMTSWIVGHDHRFACAVSQRGVYFLSSFWATTDGARILIDDEFGTNPIEGSDFLWQRSPAAYAKNIKTPLRIIHSDSDYRAPIPDAEMLYMAIKHSNPKLPVDFVRYPSEGHELSRSGQPNRRLDRLEKIVEWFDKYCQPKKLSDKEKEKEKIQKIKDDYKKKMQEKIKEVKK